MAVMPWLMVGLSVGVIGCGGPPAGSELTAAVDQQTDGNDASPLTLTANKTFANQESLWTRQQGEDWPSFLGPHSDGRSGETGLKAPWPANGPRMVWQAKLGVGYAPPTVAKGRLFEYHRHGKQARLTARHAETGDVLWTYEHPTNYDDLLGYNNGPRCSPIVDDDRVYIYSAEGRLTCVTAREGKEVWVVDTFNDFNVVQNFFGVGSTPIVVGAHVIVQVGGSPPGSPANVYAAQGDVKSTGSALVAFEKRTGKVVYQVGADLASYSSPVAATMHGRPWCFAWAREGLHAFHPETGKLDFFYPWRAKLLESVNAANPIVVNDLVFISETYGPGSSLLRVPTAGEPEVVWKDDGRRKLAMQTHWNTCVHHQGYLYGSSGRHKQNAELRCIELATGKVKWSVPNLSRASLTYIDGHLICLAEVGAIFLLKANPEKAELVSECLLQDKGGRPLLKEPAWAAPVISHGLMYVRGDHVLACLEIIPDRK